MSDELAFTVQVPTHKPKAQEYRMPPVIGRGAIRVCWGHHPEGADCVWEDFVRSPTLIQELIAERKKLIEEVRDGWERRAKDLESRLDNADRLLEEADDRFLDKVERLNTAVDLIERARATLNHVGVVDEIGYWTEQADEFLGLVVEKDRLVGDPLPIGPQGPEQSLTITGYSPETQSLSLVEKGRQES